MQKRKLISNEYRCQPMEPDLISREVNRARGFHMDPCELLMRLEERALALYESRTMPAYANDDDQYSFIQSWVGRKIEEMNYEDKELDENERNERRV